MVVKSPHGKILRKRKGETEAQLSRRQTREFLKKKVKRAIIKKVVKRAIRRKVRRAIIKKVRRYMIIANENFGKRRRVISPEFKTKLEAIKFLRKLLAPGKKRRLPSGKILRLTSFRDAQSGTGIKNPRIVMRMLRR